MRIRFSLLSFILIAFIWACQDKNATNTNSNNHSTIVKVDVPKVHADSIYQFVVDQTNFGPRVPQTPGHDSCRLYLVNKLKSYGWHVTEQKGTGESYTEEIVPIINIIASYNKDALSRIMLCAHYDTRHIADQDIRNTLAPILGANDGGSGVAVLIEIARMLAMDSLDIGIDIILFDAEDQGQPQRSLYPRKPHTWCLGSQYWSYNLHKPGYAPKFGILVDMVGGKDAEFTMEETSREYAGSVLRKVWDTGIRHGFSKYFSFEKTPFIIDDHYYINQITHIPTIDIIEYEYSTETHFGSYWHTHQDNMDIIDKATLFAVAQTILAVIYEENRLQSI